MVTAKQQVPVKTEVATTKPVGRALSPFEEMDEWLGNFFSKPLVSPLWERAPFRMSALEGRMPHVDVIDRDDDILVRAELPGVEKKNIEISATGNMLSLKATTEAAEETGGDYYRCEISRGSFSRMIALPGDVDGSKAVAALKDGLLEVTLPKAEKAKRQKIAIK